MHHFTWRHICVVSFTSGVTGGNSFTGYRGSALRSPSLTLLQVVPSSDCPDPTSPGPVPARID
jgi:hypothetical protein